jgi:RNA polymerase sigma factor for flagellar operon FliA
MITSVVSLDESWAEFIRTRRPGLRDKLITQYVPFVRFVVSRLGIPSTGILDIEDLVSYGTIGLINAIDRYDPGRGVRFEAFATPRIRGAVIDQLRSLNWLPRSAVARIRQIESAFARLEQRLGRFASEEEIAAEIGVTVPRYRQMLLEMSTNVLSLDAPLGTVSQEDELVALSDLLEDRDTIGPADYTERRELLEALCTAIEGLPERERLVLLLYYQEELTMKEISRIVGVSESRVCQLHMQAIVHLRILLNGYRAGATAGMETQQAIRSWKSKSCRAQSRSARVVRTNNLVTRDRTRSQQKAS